MHERFPKLDFINPTDPTPEQKESGLWCPPGYEPDESNVTVIGTTEGVTQEFAGIVGDIAVYGKEEQMAVALSSPHSHRADDHFYRTLRMRMQWFANATEGHPRVAVREGRMRHPSLLDNPDKLIIEEQGDASYFQALAERKGIDCISAEPVNDTDMLAVQHAFPELKHQVNLYAKMRLLPQTYRYLSQTTELMAFQPRAAFYHVLYFCRMRENELAGKPAARIYRPIGDSDQLKLLQVSSHLKNSHGLNVTKLQLSNLPDIEVVDQIFKCTNSPVAQAEPECADDLCDIQKVAVLVNRLRERRIMTLLHELTQKGMSWVWMSGPLHFEVARPGLERLAADTGLDRVIPSLGSSVVSKTASIA